MIVIDTSALVAIIEGEPDHQRYLDAIDTDADRAMSAVTLYETAVRLFCRNRDFNVVSILYEMVETLNIDVVEFDRTAAEHALEVYTSYGKGIHPAKLNLVDCVAYALARHTDSSLLFKGNDFSRTDIRPSL